MIRPAERDVRQHVRCRGTVGERQRVGLDQSFASQTQRGHLALTFQRSKPASVGQPSSVQRATEKGQQRAADVLDLDPAWKLASVDAVVDVGLERLEPSAQLVRQLGRQTEQGDHPRRRRRRDRTGGRAAGRHGLQSVRQRKSRKGREGKGRRRRAAGASRTSRRAKRSPADSVRQTLAHFSRPFSLDRRAPFYRRLAACSGSRS